MATEEGSWEIFAGESQTLETTVVIIDAASTGTPGALRTLTHPDTGNFPITTYNRNPDRTINFDQVPLAPPISEDFLTLGTTQVFVQPTEIDDVIVTERWEGAATRASMTASQFRRLYELVINKPPFAAPEVFIQWAPADRTDKVYNVILMDIRVGGGSRELDVKEVGLFAAGSVDAVATGLLDRAVELDLKIVSEVA